MPKTLADTRRHIREWGAFFRDMEVAGAEAVDVFLKARTARKYLKQSLRRLVAGGFVREREGKFMLTRKGHRFFLKIGGGDIDRNCTKHWDGKWRLVSFDVPSNRNVMRDRLRALLKEYGFYQLHKSVWVCPVIIAPDFWETVVGEGLDQYCKVMVVDILEGDEDLRKHFKLPLVDGRRRG